MIVGSGPLAPSAAGLSGYTPPRPQIDYPNGTIIYLGATTTASTSPPTAATTTPSSTPITTPAAVSASSSPFLIDRQLWDEGPDILALQQFLNTHGFQLASTGAGSPGNETDTFGLHTYAALIKFQEAYNLPATGYFGPLTRAAFESMTASSTEATSTAQ
jgi:peptidoglycan hydrolase-like protein with peptidoglycan-binding domain